MSNGVIGTISAVKDEVTKIALKNAWETETKHFGRDSDLMPSIPGRKKKIISAVGPAHSKDIYKYKKNYMKRRDSDDIALNP